ncbi:MAG: hypothetical protein RL885_29575 [Planctomycetota bacterium]
MFDRDSRRTVRRRHRSSRAIGWAAFAFSALPLSASAQILRSSPEPPDVYELSSPIEPTQYERDPESPRVISNPDFFCTYCSREGRIAIESREEIKDALEIEITYPLPLEGRKSRRHGEFRLMERAGQEVVDALFHDKKIDDPVFIEDRMFRLFTAFDGFSTRKDKYPRREEELEQLSVIFPEISEKTVKLSPHHRAHLYLIRAHRVLRDFEAAVHFDPKAEYMTYAGPYLGVNGKFEIYIFGDQRAMNEFRATYLGHKTELDGECWHTLRDDSMVAIMHAENLKDVWLNNTFTYRLSYNFIQCFRRYAYDLPSWLVLGWAHLMERRERTDFNTFTFGEGRLPDSMWGASRWKPDVRRRVLGDDVRPLVELANFTQANDVQPNEHGIVWSWVSYLLQLDSDKFARFVNIVEDKQQGESIYNLQVRAFQETYGRSMIELFEDWKKWVVQTYPKR